MENQFYSTFYIAGFTYWNGLEVFDDLKIGTQLRLEVEPSNGHDPNAVKILYKETMLGYIPRGENEEISKFLQLDYADLFNTRINRINPDAHPEKQISVVVKINRKQILK
jgi:hypothetical protein